MYPSLPVLSERAAKYETATSPGVPIATAHCPTEGCSLVLRTSGAVKLSGLVQLCPSLLEICISRLLAFFVKAYRLPEVSTRSSTPTPAKPPDEADVPWFAAGIVNGEPSGFLRIGQVAASS